MEVSMKTFPMCTVSFEGLLAADLLLYCNSHLEDTVQEYPHTNHPLGIPKDTK